PARRDFGPDSAEAAAFREAAADWATWLDGFTKAPQPKQLPALDTAALRDQIASRLDPDATVPRRTGSLVAAGSWDGAGDRPRPARRTTSTRSTAGTAERSGRTWQPPTSTCSSC